jgi:hypothetical protein
LHKENVGFDSSIETPKEVSGCHRNREIISLEAKSFVEQGSELVLADLLLADHVSVLQSRFSFY